MSYLGRGLEQVDNISKLDNITFNGGTTYALTKDSAAFTPISSNALLVSIDGVIQQGNFSVSGTNIVFNFSPTGSNTCDFIMHYGTGVAFTPADSSITKDKTNFVSTSSAAGLEVKGDGTTDGTLQLNCSQNSHGVKIKSPAHSAGQSYTLTLPTTAPASNKMLQTDGSGNLSFVDAPSGVSELLHEASITNETGGHDDYTDAAYFHPTNYDRYRVYIDEYEPASDGSNLLLQLFLGDQLRTSNYYEYHTKLFQSNSDAAVNRSTGTSSIRIIDDTGNSSQESARCWFEYGSHETDNSSFFKLIQYSFVTKTSGDTTSGGWGAGTTEESTGALYGFRLIPSAGGLGNYKIRIYGMKS